jgi:hypothetical protein
MNKILFISFSFCVIILKTNAQMRDTTLNSNTFKVDAKSLFLKSKKQKTDAWILLGGGTVIAIAGYTMMVGSAKEANLISLPSGGSVIVFTIGAASMISSIPSFISSAKNKKRANLVLKNENAFFTPSIKLTKQFLAIGVKLEM